MKNNSRVKILAAILAISCCAMSVFSGCSSSGTTSSTPASSTAGSSSAASPEAESSETTGEVTTVRIMTQFGEATKHAGIEAISEAVSKLYPQYKFEATHLPYDKYVEKLKQEMAAGDPPSIFTGRVWEFPEFVAAGKVVDLTDQEFINTYDQTAIAEATYEADRKIYAVPYDRDAKGMWYRKEIFKELGVEVPTTKSEYIAMCDKIKAAGITPVSFGGAETNPCLSTLECFLYPLLEATNPDANAKIVAGEISILDVPEYREGMINAYDMFIPYIEESDMGISRERSYDFFTGLQRPMTSQGSYVVGVFREADPDGEFGLFPIPWSENPEDNKVNAGSDDSLMASTDGVVDAALKWLEYASSVEGLNIWAENSGMLTASTLAPQVDRMDPMCEEMLHYFETDKAFYRGDMTLLSGNYSAEWENISQKFFSDGIAAYQAGQNAEDFVDTFLQEVDARFKSLV